jgi:hypothetical protein
MREVQHHRGEEGGSEQLRETRGKEWRKKGDRVSEEKRKNDSQRWWLPPRLQMIGPGADRR